MLIVGAKGFAKELLEVILQRDPTANVAFFDNVDQAPPEYLFSRFPVLRSMVDAKEYLKNIDRRFTLGVGGPTVRKKLFASFEEIGGVPTTVISPHSQIGKLGNIIGHGSCIMTGVVLTSDILIGAGCLINLNCTVGHDCRIGDFCELSPGVHISGHVEMGTECNIGTGSVLLPGVRLGDDVTVGAGAVVTKDVPSGQTVVGIPAKPINR